MSKYYAFTEREFRDVAETYVLMPSLPAKLFERRCTMRTTEAGIFEKDMTMLISSGNEVVTDEIPWYLKNRNFERRPLKEGLPATL